MLSHKTGNCTLKKVQNTPLVFWSLNHKWLFLTSLSNNLRTFFSLLSMNETTLTPLISTLTSPVSWLLLLYCNAPSYGTVALWSSFYTSTLYFPSILAVTSLGERLYQEHWNRKEKKRLNLWSGKHILVCWLEPDSSMWRKPESIFKPKSAENPKFIKSKNFKTARAWF